jgi:hypothetical protein
MANSDAIEIKITAKGGKRLALYRRHGTASRFWHYMPVRQAEKALRNGVVSIGLVVNARAVAAEV